MKTPIQSMSDRDLSAALDLFRRTGEMPEHRAKLESERNRRNRHRRGKEAA